MDDFIADLLNLPNTKVLSYKIKDEVVYIHIDSTDDGALIPEEPFYFMRQFRPGIGAGLMRIWCQVLTLDNSA